jgi:phage FluMu gp28-like protein
MHKVPTRQQEQILWYLLRALQRFTGAMDATGPGQTLAEYTADEFGTNRIAQINLNRSWYGTWMPKLIQAFEDGVITVPADDNVKQDLHSIEDIDGIPMVSPVRKEDLKDPELYRHGDTAIALVLAWYASVAMNAGPVTVNSRRRRSSTRLLENY